MGIEPIFHAYHACALPLSYIGSGDTGVRTPISALQGLRLPDWTMSPNSGATGDRTPISRLPVSRPPDWTMAPNYSSPSKPKMSLSESFKTFGAAPKVRYVLNLALILPSLASLVPT